MGYDFIPAERGVEPIHKDVTYELDQCPEDRTEARLERHVAPTIRGHERPAGEYGDARQAVSDIEEGYISSSCCILANVSMKLGRALNWDTQKGVVHGNEEATSLLHRPYRKPSDPPGGEIGLTRRTLVAAGAVLACGVADAAPAR